MLEWIIFGIVVFVTGWVSATICVRKECNGDLIVKGDELYLNLSNKDYELIHSKNVSAINIHIKRK